MFSHIGKYSNVYMNIKYMTFYLHESFHLFKAKIIYLLFFTEEFNESSKNLILFKTIVMTCFLSQLVL